MPRNPPGQGRACGRYQPAGRRQRHGEQHRHTALEQHRPHTDEGPVPCQLHLAAAFGRSQALLHEDRRAGQFRSRDTPGHTTGMIVAASVFVIASDEFGARGAASISSGLNERLGAISLEDTTTNIFEPTLQFRGFTASPLLGLPQGIAVYQNGVRINEPFGDTVQFDLVPLFALDRLQLSAGEPTFGLNALGGALALRLKNGFDNRGFQAELSVGSFQRLTGTAEFGARRGPWAVYLGKLRPQLDTAPADRRRPAVATAPAASSRLPRVHLMELP